MFWGRARCLLSCGMGVHVIACRPAATRETVWHGDRVFFRDVIMCSKSDMCCLVEMGTGHRNINSISG